MTLKDLIRRVALHHGASSDLVEGFLLTAVEEVILDLHRGESVKVRGLGTLQWKHVKGSPARGFRKTDVPPGWKLCFIPARRFRLRRKAMSDDDGMSKYGVELDDEKTKQASKGAGEKDLCPTCQHELDDARACPVHGTEPLEPTGR